MPVSYPPQHNRGRLFKNDRTKSPKAPAYTGTAVVDGVQYRVAAWINEPDERNATATISLHFESQDDAHQRRQAETEELKAREAPNQAPPRQAPLNDEPDDDIPF